MNKETLKQYGQLKRKKETLALKVEEREATIDGLGAQIISDMPKGGEAADMGDKIAQLVDMKQELFDMVLQIQVRLGEIERSILQLEDPIEQEVLLLRYVEGLSWEEVCVTIGYAWAHVHRVHAKALKNIAA